MKKVLCIILMMTMLLPLCSTHISAEDKISDGFDNVIFFEDFESYPQGSLSTKVIKSITEYEKVYNGLGWSERRVNFPEIEGEEGLKHVTIDTDGKEGAVDNYFRTRPGLINKNHTSNLLRGEALNKVQTAKFTISLKTDVFTKAAITSIVHKSLTGEDKRPQLDFVTFTEDGTLVLKNGREFSYSKNKDYKFEIYANFKKDKYSVFMNDELLDADIPMQTGSSEAYALTFGIRLDETSANGKIFIDDLGYFTSSVAEGAMSLISAFPENGKTDVSVLGSRVEFKYATIFGDAPEESKVTVSPATDYTVSTNGNIIRVSFEDVLAFDTPYTVTLAGTIEDAAGREFSVNNSVGFRTEKPNIFADAPVITGSIGGTVTAICNVVDPTGENLVKLILAAYNEDGKMVGITPVTQTTEIGNNPLSATLNTRGMGASYVRAFAVKEDSTILPLTNSFSQLGGVIETPLVETVKADASFTGEGIEFIENSYISVSGSVNKPGIRMLVLSLKKDNNQMLIVPIYTKADGSFSYKLPLEDADASYTAEIFGKAITKSVKEQKYYLATTSRQPLVTEINGTDNVENFLNTNKEKLNIKNEYITKSSVAVLKEQLPVSDISEIKEILEKVNKIEKIILNDPWTELDKLYTENSNILFGNQSESYAKYAVLSATEKNKLNSSIVQKQYSDILEFREEFEKLITNPGGGSGGSGGSGGTSGADSSGGKNDAMLEYADGAVADKKEFNDIEEALWVSDAARELKRLGILSGDGNGNLRPNDNIKRSEFVKLLTLAAGINPGGECSFTDVQKGAWYVPYLAAMQKIGIIQGNGNGAFGVNDTITREDMAVMIFRMTDYLGVKTDNSVIAQPKDYQNISSYAQNAVAALYGMKIINGMEDGSFMPKQSSTRAQAVKIIYELINIIEEAV